MSVDVVIPTRNRADLVVGKVLTLLKHPRVGSVVVVADGCTDDTVSRLTALNDDRVLIVPLNVNLGPPTARNAGIKSATRDWILLTDDDDELSDNFLDECLAIAELAQADVVGAPWLHLSPYESLESALARTPVEGPGPRMDRPSVFPDSRWCKNVWFTPNMLISRRAALLSFDASYRGNFYREESDFIVRVARAGFNTVVVGSAYSYSGAVRAGGGIRRDSPRLRFRYEYWALRNTVMFLKRHGAWIAENGHGRPTLLTVQFIAWRIRLLVGGLLSRLRKRFS